MKKLLIAASIIAAATGANLRRRHRSPADMLEKPKWFAIEGPEGPNIFHPESLPVWMRPTAPGGDGAGSQIGAAASAADTPDTNSATKEAALNSKFGDASSSSSSSSSSLSSSTSSSSTSSPRKNNQNQNHHHHHNHQHQHQTDQKFQSAGEGEDAAPAEGAAEGDGGDAGGGIPTEGIPQGPAGGAPTSGPLAPALPSNPQVGMMFPAGMSFSGAPSAWPLGGAMGPPPGSSTVDMGQGGTTPFHISTSPMAGNTLSGGGKATFGTVVSPIMPGAPGPDFK